jgi:hypothetical protein
MIPTGTHFALIGRAYPCEMFELWAQVSRSARERRKVVRTVHGPREQTFFKNAKQDSARG